MYMPADALQAIDISRSDFMRRKVLLAGTLYQYYTKGGYRSTCPAPGALHVPAFDRSGFLHQHVVVLCSIYFFGVPAVIYTVRFAHGRAACARFSRCSYDAARFGMSNISIYLECPLTRSMRHFSRCGFLRRNIIFF